MCNLYSQTKSQDAMRHVFDDVLKGEIEDRTGNLPPLPGIYPDYPGADPAPPRGRELAARDGPLGHAHTAEVPRGEAPGSGCDQHPQCGLAALAALAWGRTSLPRHQLLGDRRPPRRAAQPSGLVRAWHRSAARFFAGVRTDWTSVRKVKEGEITAELFGFLTSAPNREVGAVHPGAMPVILTRPEEWRQWLTAPAAEALALQRPLPDGALEIVLEGAHEDAA